MSKKGFFLTFEGTDGVGKSTQARELADFLMSRGHSVQLTREPGGGRVAERIRALLLDPDLKMAPLTELFLYEAARVEHLETLIRPALAEGKVVICDRFTDSTIAYQGYARGLLRQAIDANRVATGGLNPNLTILLRLPPKLGFEKARARSGNGDRLENEGLPFQKKVAAGFLAWQKRQKKRIKVVDVRDSIEATQSEIRRLVLRHLND